jgi:hypothetical protein
MQATITMQQEALCEVDAKLSVGFTKGRVALVDGSILEFSEQFPTERGLKAWFDTESYSV